MAPNTKVVKKKSGGGARRNTRGRVGERYIAGKLNSIVKLINVCSSQSIIKNEQACKALDLLAYECAGTLRRVHAAFIEHATGFNDLSRQVLIGDVESLERDALANALASTSAEPAPMPPATPFHPQIPDAPHEAPADDDNDFSQAMQLPELDVDLAACAPPPTTPPPPKTPDDGYVLPPPAFSLPPPTPDVNL